MKVFCYRTDFRIKSKKDAEKFLNMATDPDFGKYDGDLYWSDGETDYCLDAKRASVSTRPVFCRGDIFSPYFDEGRGDVKRNAYIDTIWRTRKYINATWFAEERW